ncbi:hypothetical protein BC936DRAFT_148244 [Jimgerdemannia flammicorona]|uniref:LysM domain-containing protein n=1 Tax=Jimgerdemannia flammicorona TaxID=994334 RepID=A0A433D3H3_9FUNG|nr:hypothetical protein BC936DRAFT_148244 [Jimgerdemannia flammicorona]
MKFTTVAIVIAAALVGQSQAAPKFNADCKRFHTVGAGDSCASVATQYGITTTQLFSWNGGLHTTCDNLDNGSLVCVSLTGPMTTDGPSGVVAPSGSANPSASSSAKPASVSGSKATSSAPPAASASASDASAAPSSPSEAASSAAASASASIASTSPSTSTVKPNAGARESVPIALLLASVVAASALVL